MKIIVVLCVMYFICMTGYALLDRTEITPLSEAERYNKFLAEETIKKEMVIHEAWKYLDNLSEENN